VLSRLATFDFTPTRTNSLAFVHSIAGSHTSPEAKTGQRGLSAAVRELGLVPKEGESIQIDYVCSSVGSLTGKFLERLHAAATGEKGEDVGTTKGKDGAKTEQDGRKGLFDPPKRRKAREQESEAAGPVAAPSFPTYLRIYFPSTRTIARSLGGPTAAGTICFKRRSWEHAKFPRGVLRDCVAVPSRAGVLMHSKVMFVRFEGEERKVGEHAGWVYVGSANASESAWGVVSEMGKGKGKKDFKTMCRNWECGIVVPVPVQEGTMMGLEGFERVLPVPMVFPGESYEENRELEPWFFGKGEGDAS
jgi:hypothetical protein